MGTSKLQFIFGQGLHENGPEISHNSQECTRTCKNIAMCDYQESVTTRQTHGRTDRQISDKVIPISVPARK